MNIIFGTDGWRGLLDSEMNKKSVSIVAQAFSDYLKNNFKNNITAAVGFDGRRLSKEFANIFAKILSGNGIKVFLSDSICPTPVLSYYVKANSLNAGIMITASHNPDIYNGVKFKANYGGPFPTEETLKVEQLLGINSINKNKKNVIEEYFLPVYLNQLEKYVDFEMIKKSGLKILIDSMGGAGQEIISSLLSKYGIESKTIFGKASQDFYGRNAEPIKKNLYPLSKELKKEKIYAFGIATDGDADRCGVMLSNGKWLSAQETILLLTDYIVNTKKISGHIVKTSSVTDKLRSNFETVTRKVYDVQVGFKYVCEKMIEEEVAFGCEESGGYGYKNHIPERDGILTGLILLEMLANSGNNKLSDLVTEKRKQFGNIFYDRIDFDYENEDRIQKLPELYRNPPQLISGFKVKSMYKFFSSRGDINGLKFILEGDCRWLLLRASETEPMVRIYSEGQSDSDVNNLLEQGMQFIKSKIHI
ncbi:MAG: phosphoglucomutase [Ignavibacteriales bacterium]|nr:phosphoglucomutase [Ignavibacteriales bacterium]